MMDARRHGLIWLIPAGMCMPWWLGLCWVDYRRNAACCSLPGLHLAIRCLRWAWYTFLWGWRKDALRERLIRDLVREGWKSPEQVAEREVEFKYHLEKERGRTEGVFETLAKLGEAK